MKWSTSVVVAISLPMSTPTWAAFELSYDCLFYNNWLGIYDGPIIATYTEQYPFPSKYSAPRDRGLRVDQDNHSRFISGWVRWTNDDQIKFFKSGRRLGFEYETLFYNYDDATTTGLGPAYVLDAQGAYRCDFPNCYRDTQLFSATNSLGEYSEVNIAFGSYDVTATTGTPLVRHRVYSFATRATTGRGNKSRLKVNWQLVEKKVPNVSTPANMFRCKNSEDFRVLSFQQGMNVPVCITTVGAQSTQSWIKCP